ncbi:nucleoredoxin 1 [Populus alba x Populus x berolinensis]|uniref:protein-disulfide reductase n=1 Tax=Populus alba x Populus x berolinensis TaxID=444605 RepID=A0AAD6MA24_9ROSI|nr:nucleoredoxin 1 [Populus alba x Populus x berolinensis]
MATEDVSLDLSTLLSSEERDFLIRNNGDQVKVSNLVGKIVGFYFSGSWCGPCRNFTPLLVEVYEQLSSKGDFEVVRVSDLVGKNILLYFSAQWCPPCRAFLPKLIEAYHTIKGKGNAFEVIFISSDSDQSTFDEFYSEMPWLALPFGDERKQILSRKFKIKGIPAAVAIGPSGRTITKEARMHLTAYGADAFPFTEEHLKQLEEEIEEKAKGWPEKVKHELHTEHELIRAKRKACICKGCRETGYSWSFYCKECDFDLHPKCALKEDEKNSNELTLFEVKNLCLPIHI